jgi:hypothetical protein
MSQLYHDSLHSCILRASNESEAWTIRVPSLPRVMSVKFAQPRIHLEIHHSRWVIGQLRHPCADDTVLTYQIVLQSERSARPKYKGHQNKHPKLLNYLHEGMEKSAYRMKAHQGAKQTSKVTNNTHCHHTVHNLSPRGGIASGFSPRHRDRPAERSWTYLQTPKRLVGGGAI